MGRKQQWTDAAQLAGFKLLISAFVLLAGFRALSDDDYARVVIAQSFAEAPRLDPSGSSWLPAPFWLTGSAMLAFGRDVLVARGVALLSGVAAVLLLWTAARWLGASRRGALVGAALAGAFPYAAWLGVAMVPEALTAALIAVGAAAATQQEPRRVLGGAAALALACLSRYEAWPAAAVVALVLSLRAVSSGQSAARASRRALLGAAALACAGAVGWLIHGALIHGDALFFVKRVAEYHRAVGGQGGSLAALVRAPLSVLRCEPELVIVAACAALGAGSTLEVRRYRVLAAAAAALLVFLMIGDARSAAPTHHAERAVLAVWYAVALFAGDAIDRAVRRPRRRGLPAWAGAALLFAATAVFTLRPWFARRDDFIDRADHVEIGAHARALAAPTERLAVDTPDFGFYAVIAGFGAPSRAAPVHDRDPRRSAPDPFASEAALAARLNELGAHFLVVQGAERTTVALPFGERRGRMADLTLLRRE